MAVHRFLGQKYTKTHDSAEFWVLEIYDDILVSVYLD